MNWICCKPVFLRIKLKQDKAKEGREMIDYQMKSGRWCKINFTFLVDLECSILGFLPWDGLSLAGNASHRNPPYYNSAGTHVAWNFICKNTSLYVFMILVVRQSLGSSGIQLVKICQEKPLVSPESGVRYHVLQFNYDLLDRRIQLFSSRNVRGGRSRWYFPSTNKIRPH